MTATSTLEKVEGLIEVASQRLIPQALQRLTVKEILGEYVVRMATLLDIPTKGDLGITPESEVDYTRLVKFLRLHEPTGHERDAAHKYDVVRFLTLKQMLHECQHAKLPHIQAACLEKIVEWFDTTGSKLTVLGSASTPVLPPRMSPKKATMPSDIAMGKSASEDSLATTSVDVMKKAAVAQKLEKYKMPDIRASHIRRVAQLRSRGVYVLEDDVEIPESDVRPEDEGDFADPILEPLEYEERDRRERIKATFKNYEPQTEAEFAMNQIWLECKREEDQEKDKAQEVRGKLQSWSLNKSRDESEYLRKREAMQLAAGLDKFVEGQLEIIRQPRHRHLEKKKQEWQALQQTAPPSVIDRPDQGLLAIPSGPQERVDQEEGESTPARTARVALQRDSVRKNKASAGALSTPIGSGGMHFRNQLPANYTPQSKRSHGTPTSFSSKDSSSTPNTPLSTSSSGKLQLLDEAATRAERRAVRHAGYSDSPVSSDGSPPVHDDDDERVEGSLPSSTLRFSERVHESRPELKFQPFHTTSLSNHGSLPLSRAVSASALNLKLHPRGTIPPQAEPIDLEYRHLHAAATNRKPPLPTSILPDKPLVGHGRNSSTLKAPSTTSNQRDSIRPASTATATKLLPRTTRTSAAFQSVDAGVMSEFRSEQMHEVNRIRVLFEQHNLSIPLTVVERGLLLPEDRSALECVHNLPLPGSRLIPNPLLQVRVKTKSTKKKKKKKKKGAKGGAKKTKGKNSAGDLSKSPTKKKKK